MSQGLEKPWTVRADKNQRSRIDHKHIWACAAEKSTPTMQSEMWLFQSFHVVDNQYGRDVKVLHLPWLEHRHSGRALTSVICLQWASTTSFFWQLKDSYRMRIGPTCPCLIQISAHVETVGSLNWRCRDLFISEQDIPFGHYLTLHGRLKSIQGEKATERGRLHEKVNKSKKKKAA